MNAGTVTPRQKRRLQSHFAFHRVPFRKAMGAHEMFDSRSQRDLASTSGPTSTASPSSPGPAVPGSPSPSAVSPRTSTTHASGSSTSRTCPPPSSASSAP